MPSTLVATLASTGEGGGAPGPHTVERYAGVVTLGAAVPAGMKFGETSSGAFAVANSGLWDLPGGGDLSVATGGDAPEIGDVLGLTAANEAGKVDAVTADLDGSTVGDVMIVVGPDSAAPSPDRKSIVWELGAPGVDVAVGDGMRVPIDPALDGLDLISVSGHIITAGATDDLTVQFVRIRGGVEQLMLTTALTFVDTAVVGTLAVVSVTASEIGLVIGDQMLARVLGVQTGTVPQGLSVAAVVGNR